MQKDWWTYRAPANMTLEQLQQLAASKLGAATAAAVGGASAGYTTDSSSNTNPPQVQASGGPTQQDSSSGSSAISATMALIHRWIIAEVGLAAQQELSQPNMQSRPQQVRAADQPTAAVQVSADGTSTVSVTLPQGLQAVQLGPQLLVTAQVAADRAAGGEGSRVAVTYQQPAGSRNQDPGISVDPQAVAQPGKDPLKVADAVRCLVTLLSCSSCFKPSNSLDSLSLSGQQAKGVLKRSACCPAALLSCCTVACSHHCAHHR